MTIKDQAVEFYMHPSDLSLPESAEMVKLRAGATYTRTAVILHWLIAGLIVVNVALGLSASYVAPERERAIVDLHKSIGLTVLGLAIIRLLWRVRHHPPRLPATVARYEAAAAHVTHACLYILMFALPLSGWIHDSAWSGAATHPMKLFGVIPWFRLGLVANLPPDVKTQVHTLSDMIHTWLGYALYVLVGLHVLGALKHQLIDKEKFLQRMRP